MPIRKSLHFLSVILIWDTRLATLTPGIPGFLKKPTEYYLSKIREKTTQKV